MNMFIGKEIEITHLNPSTKSVGILIHIYCNPTEVGQLRIQTRVAELVKIGCKYLRDEGFFPDNLNGWITYISGVTHPETL